MIKAYLYRNGYCARKINLQTEYPSWTIPHYSAAVLDDPAALHPMDTVMHEVFFLNPAESRKPHLVDNSIRVYDSVNWEEVQKWLAENGIGKERAELGFYPEVERSA